MIRFCVAASLLALACPVGFGDQYWIQYDPSVSEPLFPEQAGWTRHTHAGGDLRCFEDESLVLDGLASTQIADYYEMYPVGGLNPGPGELFVARWTLRVAEATAPDAFIGIWSEGWNASFELDEGTISSFDEPGVSAPFAPGEFHQFEFRSSDMRTYQLSCDGAPCLTGSLHYQLPSSRVIWGDGAIGSASVTYWRGFEFGVIPEPGGLVLSISLGFVVSICRRAGRLSRRASRAS
jgi:hypothetical protein